ncbi:hypothetical protein TNCV_2200781 [Trichonephila clavipes]|nr:hypothetical protein TNCV_2200781 [Trichonephila clavipes]
MNCSPSATIDCNTTHFQYHSLTLAGYNPSDVDIHDTEDCQRQCCGSVFRSMHDSESIKEILAYDDSIPNSSKRPRAFLNHSYHQHFQALKTMRMS